MKNIKPTEVIDSLDKHLLVDGFHVVIDLEKSEGNYFRDAISGKEYLDCYTYFASLPVGHNHPEMQDESFLENLKRAAVANPANSDIYCTEYASAVDTFAKLAKPKEFSNLFFVAGGALAVENALKTAFDWKYQKNMQNNNAKIVKENNLKIMHLKEAFHGRSGYTLSITNTDATKTKYFPKFDWPRIDNPKLRFPLTDGVRAEIKNDEEKAITQAKNYFHKNKDQIAAFIMEPIQGEGGDNHFSEYFIKEMRNLCDENEALLIFDEVQTGIGATGKMWCYQHYDVVPDIIAFGKKTQACGIMATPKIHEIETNVFNVSSRINSTWGANLADFVRGAKYLEIIKKENLVQNAAVVGEHFKGQLAMNLYETGKVQNVRGRGLFLAFDTLSGKDRDEIRSKAWDRGLATLACGEKSIRFRPPLTFTKNDVTEAMHILEECI